MLARAEHGDAHAFQIADHQMGVVARNADMRKARQIGVGDCCALHRLGQMAQTRAEDQAEFDRGGPCAGLDFGDQVLHG